MDRLGFEMLCVFGMPPVDYVRLVADLGCHNITTGMIGFAPVKVLGINRFRYATIPGCAESSLRRWANAGCRSHWGRAC